MIVADANILIYLVYETSFSVLARRVYARDSEWFVPDLWEAEVLNGLMNEIRAKHTRLGDAIQAAVAAGVLVKGKVHRCDPVAVLRTAEEARLTAYDAYYVVLARVLGVSLITEDKKVLRACPDVALSMKSFLGLPEKPSGVGEKRAAYRTRRKKK